MLRGFLTYVLDTMLERKRIIFHNNSRNEGSVPSKTLIKTAHVYHLMKHAQKFGLPSVDLPPVDFREVSKRIQSVIEIIQKHDSEERFCSLGAKVKFGDPAFSDEYRVKLGGSSISAKTTSNTRSSGA